MFESMHQLARRPFGVAPDAETYFAATAIEDARRALVRSIERAEGVGLVIGAAGTGKSLLCHLLANQFRDQFEVALLAGAQLATRRALLQAILFELNQPYRGMDEGELRLHLIDHLTRRNSHERGVLLVVDEAQILSTRLLEELRLITNVVRQGVPRVRLVLAGGAALDERFATPQLENFCQRIAVRCYLQAFKYDETLGYVAHQIRICGGDATQIFAPEALDAIHRATDGIPRLINQLCDHALVLAFAAGVKTLGAAEIEEAWADLQQLPMPWRESTSRGASDHGGEVADVIEFGGLDDDDLDAERPKTASAANQARESEYDSTVENLAEIEEHVDSMADEFRAAGSIRREVEFVLPDLVPARHESFDDEEVVLDRYAELDASVCANLPQVSSHEGRELSRLLERYAKAKPIERVRTSSAANPAKHTATHAQETTRRTLGSVAEADRAEQKTAAPRQVVSLEHLSHVEVRDRDADDDLIVVEEESAEVELTLARPIAPVRRQEYRQLFARLRHG